MILKINYISTIHLLTYVIIVTSYSYRVNAVQRRLLGDIERKKLFKCPELFVGWLQGGLYDFTTLSVSMFKHMNPKDTDAIMSLHTKYPCKSLL